MKCRHCNGTGEYEAGDLGTRPCAHCHGSGDTSPRCHCADGGPGSYEGPLRDCPVHGDAEAQAPKEVWLMVIGQGGLTGKVYGIRETQEAARANLATTTDCVIRYVRAR